MNTRQRFGLGGLLVVLSAAAGLIAAPGLPAEMATHWNAAGRPDGTLPKPIALTVVPGLAALLLGALYALPTADPNAENIDAFRPTYDWFAVAVAGLLAVVHGGVIAFNLGYRFPFVSLVLVGVGGLLYGTGVLLGRAEQNWVIGIRTAWTLESEEVWDRTHAVGAPLFKLTGLSTLFGAAVPQYGMALLLGPLLLTTVVLFVYPYLLYRRLDADETGR